MAYAMAWQTWPAWLARVLRGRHPAADVRLATWVRLICRGDNVSCVIKSTSATSTPVQLELGLVQGDVA